MNEELRAKLLSSDSPVRSFGLRSVHDRLQMHFGAEYGISIDSSPGEGTAVVLKLPAYQEERP
jgi:two-component system sensor histidine kinase YesM